MTRITLSTDPLQGHRLARKGVRSAIKLLTNILNNRRAEFHRLSVSGRVAEIDLDAECAGMVNTMPKGRQIITIDLDVDFR